MPRQSIKHGRSDCLAGYSLGRTAWRSVKYESIYLHDKDSVGKAHSSFLDNFGFYNNERPHSGLKRKTPHQSRRTIAKRIIVGQRVDLLAA